MQKIVHADNVVNFDVSLNCQLKNGWKVVPGTYSATSRSHLGWNPLTQNHDNPMFVHDFFVVVEKEVEKEV